MPQHDPVPSRAEPPPQGLDDPEYARFAWSRFKRIMAWMTLASAVTAGGALAFLEHVYGPLNWVTRAATIGGVFFTMLLGTALMGLTFLSSGTGHDASVSRGD